MLFNKCAVYGGNAPAAKHAATRTSGSIQWPTFHAYDFLNQCFSRWGTYNAFEYVYTVPTQKFLEGFNRAQLARSWLKWKFSSSHRIASTRGSIQWPTFHADEILVNVLVVGVFTMPLNMRTLC